MEGEEIEGGNENVGTFSPLAFWGWTPLCCVTSIDCQNEVNCVLLVSLCMHTFMCL